jgi:uncharacterized protein (DUF362 family)
MVKVSLVRTSNRSQSVTQAIDLLEVNPVHGKNVILKPNFNTADPAPASTHNDTLRALVQKIKSLGATSITVAERAGPPDTREVLEKKGIFALAQELGFEIVNLQEEKAEAYVPFHLAGSHWPDGFIVPRLYRDAECVVETCCLKTHRYGGHFTLALKLAVGLVPRRGHGYMGQLHASPHERLMIAEINAAFRTDLIILDAVDAFVDGGPDVGTRVSANVILGGSDRVAVDAVGVALLRHLGTTPEVSEGPIFAQEQIARAAELGIGVASADEIQIVTGDPDSEAYAERIRAILARG